MSRMISGAGIEGQMSPVKFVLLLFFEKFNRAGRDQKVAIETQTLISFGVSFLFLPFKLMFSASN
jgi:hypothetical protein